MVAELRRLAAERFGWAELSAEQAEAMSAAVAADAPRTGEFRAENVVRHAEWGRGGVMTVEEDKLTVLFDDVGYRTLSLPVVREPQLLARC